MPNRSPETEVYKQLSRWMQQNYPDVIFRFDFSAGMKMTKGMASRHRALNPHRGYPDLFIAKPNGNYAGLFIEIKADGKSPLRKDGQLKSDKHLEEQSKMLTRLLVAGYATYFGVGLEQCKQIIESYFGKLAEKEAESVF